MTRKKYDATFKREAVTHWLKSGKPAWQIAQELGVVEAMLYKWKQQYAPPGEANELELQDQIKKLQRLDDGNRTVWRGIRQRTRVVAPALYPRGPYFG